MKKISYYTLSALFAGSIALSMVSCADDDLGNNLSDGDKEAIVQFEITDAQEEALSKYNASTRGAITAGLSDKDLEGKKLEAQSNKNLNVCLIETTVEGVNPVVTDARTRANIINLSSFGDFSSTGLRGTNASNIKEEWFIDAKTKKNGELYTQIPWSWQKPYGCFFAVYPELNTYKDKMKINKPDANGFPSVEFEIETDVRKQVDLMTACSGNVQYATRYQAPRTSLNFRHALTAIRFAVGQNLSFDKTIKQISLKNVLLKSKYVISNQYNGTGAKWVSTGYDTRGNVTLDGLNYKTNENPNSIVRDRSTFPNENSRDITKLNDNYTFYMIPQELDNKVTAEITFTDNTTISVPLKGSWKEGTTRTYKLSNQNSSWVYSITSDSPSAVAYNATSTGNYGITSFRQAPDGTKKPVAWKVIGYSEDDGNTWTTTKPAWLKSLTKESGNGGTAAEQGTATLGTDIVDLVAKRNKELQDAKPLGSAEKYYNLSNSTGEAQVQNTANCYLISAPGYYMIPLVYGNAIKNGGTNTSAYKSSLDPKSNILAEFVDHTGAPINDPWIEKTNNNANNGINGAQIVWADEANLVNLASDPIYRDGSGNAFVKFEVTKANIKSGNAVIAVKKGNTIVWSWHLWFAPKNALDKIPVTNKQNKVYNFTNETLGWKPTKCIGTSYSTPRTVKVKVEQTIANNGIKQESVFTITQNAGITERTGITTFYQWGRKDAFPGTDANINGHFNKNAGDQIYMQNIIQNPGNFYTVGFSNNGVLNPNSGLVKYYYFYNLWSINNKKSVEQNQLNDVSVVKTIYDPCPVGFNVPANDAFTGFTANGLNEGNMNVDGTNREETFKANFGHNFWTNSNKNATIFFPASGYRGCVDGNLYYVNKFGDFWLADPQGATNGFVMGIQFDKIFPLFRNIRTYGFAVRPVAE
jgi:conserved domain protein